MTLMKKFLGATAMLALSAGVAAAEPALIFDLGGKFDKSFNEAAYNGAQAWAKETGGTYKELDMQSAALRVQFARRMAESGANPIVVMGFQNEETLKEVAPDYPDTSFVLIDAVVDLPNVRSVIFAEHEGSYLVGMLGAMASKTGTVSFVGGMDIPLISAFACGYAQGAKAVNPDIKVIVNYTGDTPAAWNDPVKGGEIAKAQMSQGSDVIFAAAGGTGLGVLQAASDAGVNGGDFTTGHQFGFFDGAADRRHRIVDVGNDAFPQPVRGVGANTDDVNALIGDLDGDQFSTLHNGDSGSVYAAHRRGC